LLAAGADRPAPFAFAIEPHDRLRRASAGALLTRDLRRSRDELSA
jgi:hypothetical protein